MIKSFKLKYLAALLPCLVMGTAQAASPIPEFEPNNPIAEPQHLVSVVNTSVHAFLGNAGPDDLDYYTFYANAGDVLTIDIDHGIGGTQSVDTVIAVFDSTSEHIILRASDDLDVTQNLDEGSTSRSDARIDNFVAPVSGYYVVGVSNWPRLFRNGGSVDNPYSPRQGDYTLVVSGATPAVKQIAILIKPGNEYIAPINPRSHGKIPVAILGGPDFNAISIDTRSLTFGSTGNEDSLSKCNPQLVDLNKDGRLDLLCHFNNQDAQFKLTDAEATLRGQTFDGMQFEGTGFMKVVPVKGGASSN